MKPLRPFNTSALSSQLFVWILICSLIPTIVLATLNLQSFKQAFIAQEQAALNHVIDKKVRQIENYMDERISDVQFISSNLETKLAMQKLNKHYIKNFNQNYTYKKIENTYKDYFNRLQAHGYYDIFLVSTTGEIIFSVEHESDFATNLFTGIYKESGLSKVVQQAKYSLESNSSSFQYYEPSKEPAAFIAAPILEDGVLLGIAAYQVNAEIIQQVLLDVRGPMHSREVVVGSAKGDKYSFQAKVRNNPKIQVGEFLPINKAPSPLKKAMKGIISNSIEYDNRNKKVIAATRYIPSMQWGLVVKEDLSEVLMVYNNMVSLILIFILVVLLSVLIIAAYLGKKISQPFVELVDVSNSMAQGDLTVKAEGKGFEESLKLAKSFNRMASIINTDQNILENIVSLRTTELQEEVELRKGKETDLENSNAELKDSISQLKLAQDQLIESEKMASLGSLVAGIAHEINTPLGVAVTSSSILGPSIKKIKKSLQDGTLTKEQMLKFVTNLDEAALLIEHNLNRTTDLVKSFKQVAVEKTNLHKAEFDLNRLLETLLISLIPETKKYNVNINNAIPNNIILDSYSGDFYQLLTNLILNSLIHGFGKNKNGNLVVTANLSDHMLSLSIKDDGVGMHQDMSDRIFEPFYTSKRGTGGSGLGLSIVYNIVNTKLGGEISVISKPDEGAEFIIVCPDKSMMSE